MKKSILFLLLAAIALTSFVSCGKEKAPVYEDIFIDPDFQEIDEYDMSLTKKGSANPLVTTQFLAHAVLNPWRENASKVAQQTGTMRFYAMCATGHSNSPSWGDSCLVAFPNGQLMLIDSGIEGFGEHLVRNLRALGVEKIDYLVFSHPHDDHCYGVLGSSFLDSIQVGVCYYTGAQNESWGSNMDMVEKTMKKYNIPLMAMTEGDTLDIGEVHLQWLAPQKSVIGTSASGNTKVNNLSMAIRFDYGEFSALFAGDIESSVEDRLLAEYGSTGLLDVDLFKVSHHGSTTSNQKDFINAVSPEVALCYGGAPVSTSLYGQLSKTGSYVYCDSIDGYIRCVCSKDGKIDVSTSHERETAVYNVYVTVADKVRAEKAAN